MSALVIGSNLLVTIVAGMGVFSFTQSLVWATIGAVLITGGARANLLVALFGYPAVEFLFNDGTLTAYSAVIVGITIIQLAFVFWLAKAENERLS